MSIDATTLVGGAVGGAAVQAVLGPLFGQLHYRRDLRAKVLESLAQLERERWARSNVPVDFRRAAVGLRSTALVAGINRPLLEFYIGVAAAGWQKSQRDWLKYGEDPDGGAINSALADLVSNAAQAVASYVWQPHLKRFAVSFTIRRLQREKARVTLQMEEDQDPIIWEQIRVPP